MSDFDQFFDAYVECALWARPEVEDDPQPGDTYEIDDIEPAALESMRADCESFYNDPELADDLWRLDPASCGHDFFLSRNGHGAGFWDRGHGERSERLHAAAKVYGTQELLPAADGTLWVTS